VFAAVLELVGGGPDAALITELYREYADIQRLSFDECGCGTEIETGAMPREIRQGLTIAAPTPADLALYYQWAQSIGEKLVNHIVGNKQRGAYDRAALALGALAEARCRQESLAEAQRLLNDYYQTRYNRFAAFRKELLGCVSRSPLLRKIKL